jgi:hypothetical protein
MVGVKTEEKGIVPPLKTEKGIYSYIITHFETLVPGIRLLNSYSDHRAKGQGIDLLLDVEIGDIRKKLVGEIKAKGEPRYLFQAIAKLKQVTSTLKDSYAVVFVPFLNEKGRELCRKNEIGYIDLSGNVFLKFSGVYIERAGEKKIEKDVKLLKSLFSPVSSRIIRVLLENPQRTWRLLTISKESKASLGYVHKVVTSLLEKGYIEKGKSGIKLRDPGKLLDMWSTKYDFSVSKRYTYYSFIKDPLNIMKRIEEASTKLGREYAITMHAGASLVAPFVKFSDVYFYFAGDKATWVKELDLRPVEFGGTVHLVEPYDSGIFYKTREITGIKVVSNIQLYLDLYNYPARGREQAEFLRNEKIKY